MPEAHYVDVFATCSLETSDGYRSSFLTMSPLEDENANGADENVSLLHFVMSMFGVNVSNVVALIGDNRNVKRSISTSMETPLIGCASNCFQPALRKILAEDESVISPVKQMTLK